MLLQLLGLLGLQVVGAVLLTEQVARRLLLGGGGRRAPEAQLRPAQPRPAEREAGEVADGVHRNLRVVRAGLHAEIAAGDPRFNEVVDHLRQRLELLRQLPGEAEAIDPVLREKQAAAEAEGEGEPGGAVIGGLAGVSRRSQRVAVEGPAGRHLQAHHEPAGRIGPVFQQLDQILARLTVHHVEGGEVQLVLGGGGDTALALAMEGVLQIFQGVAAAPGDGGASEEAHPAPDDQADGTGPSRPCEQAATRESGYLSHG